VFWCVAVYCNVLLRVAVCHTFFCFALEFLVMQGVAAWRRALHGVAVRCSVLQCVAVCCSVLQCVAVWCSVLQCVSVCCGTLSW